MLKGEKTNMSNFVERITMESREKYDAVDFSPTAKLPRIDFHFNCAGASVGRRALRRSVSGAAARAAIRGTAAGAPVGQVPGTSVRGAASDRCAA